MSLLTVFLTIRRLLELNVFMKICLCWQVCYYSSTSVDTDCFTMQPLQMNTGYWSDIWNDSMIHFQAEKWYLSTANSSLVSSVSTISVQYWHNNMQLNSPNTNTWVSSFHLQELNWNSRQKATEALFVIEYESNLHVKAQLRGKRHLRFTVVSFSGKLIFNGVWGHWYASSTAFMADKKCGSLSAT